MGQSGRAQTNGTDHRIRSFSMAIGPGVCAMEKQIALKCVEWNQCEMPLRRKPQVPRFDSVGCKTIETEPNWQIPHVLDENFLAAVDHLPRCAGMAIGVDRLVMALCGLDDIREVQV